MAYLKIDQSRINRETAKELMDICPFGAFDYENGILSINAGCKMCRLCIKNGPDKAIELVEEENGSLNKDEWRGIAVYAEVTSGGLHKVVGELLGKARELALVTGHPVYALVIGSGVKKACRQAAAYGADKVFYYDSPELAEFKTDIYANVFCDFIEKVKPSSVMVGATDRGRTLAPKTAARCRTGLTADCTVLDMKENTDLIQIRPAFGGNVMAQIVTPKHRPQFCTVRYKIFSALEEWDASGCSFVNMDIEPEKLVSAIETLSTDEKPRGSDISEASVIVACGRGFKKQEDLAMAEGLAEVLGGVCACTRPLVEKGWFDPKLQIGLSGRTVKPKLIITLGVSGSVQFAAGMKGSDCIIAINQDENAQIFDIAHYAVKGDIYEIVPKLTAKIKEAAANV